MPTAIQPANFYDLSTELAAIEQALAESGGEITPEQEQQYAATIAAHLQKAENLIAVIRRAELTRDAIRPEADRLAKQAKAFDNTAKRLKALILTGMKTAGMTKIQTPRGRLQVQANGGKRPLILNPDVTAATLPEKYRKTEIVHSVDTDALRVDLESGDEARIQEAEAYACLADRGESLRIY